MLKLVGWKLLIRPEEPLAFYGSNKILYVPEKYQSRGRYGYAVLGKIEQISEEVIREHDTLELLDIRVGDSVIVDRYVGASFKQDGENLRIVAPDDIIAVVEGEDKIRIIGGHVLIKPLESAKLISNIIIPDPCREQSQEGIVEQVGMGIQFGGEDKISMDVKVGDHVFFGKLEVREIQINHETKLFMGYDNIYGVVE